MSTEFTGRTVEDAITQASISLGVTSEEIEYEVVDNGKSGLFGLGTKDAVIKAWIKGDEQKAPEEEEPSENMQPKPSVDEILDKLAAQDTSGLGKSDQKEPLSTEEGEILSERVNSFLGDVFRAMEVDVTFNVHVDNELAAMNVIVEGPQASEIIGKRGITLDALQYLTSLAINKGSETFCRVRIDSKNYRDRRQKTLENLARNVATKVKRTHRKVALEPMNAYERHIIHAYLQDDDEVTTHSEGFEPDRRIVVYYNRA